MSQSRDTAVPASRRHRVLDRVMKQKRKMKRMATAESAVQEARRSRHRDCRHREEHGSGHGHTDRDTPAEKRTTTESGALELHYCGEHGRWDVSGEMPAAFGETLAQLNGTLLDLGAEPLSSEETNAVLREGLLHRFFAATTARISAAASTSTASASVATSARKISDAEREGDYAEREGDYAEREGDREDTKVVVASRLKSSTAYAEREGDYAEREGDHGDEVDQREDTNVVVASRLKSSTASSGTSNSTAERPSSSISKTSDRTAKSSRSSKSSKSSSSSGRSVAPRTALRQSSAAASASDAALLLKSAQLRVEALTAQVASLQQENVQLVARHSSESQSDPAAQSELQRRRDEVEIEHREDAEIQRRQEVEIQRRQEVEIQRLHLALRALSDTNHLLTERCQALFEENRSLREEQRQRAAEGLDGEREENDEYPDEQEEDDADSDEQEEDDADPDEQEEDQQQKKSRVPAPPTPPPVPSSFGGQGRSGGHSFTLNLEEALMAAKLRPLTEDEKRAAKPPPSGVLSAIANALIARRRFIHVEDDSSLDDSRSASWQSAEFENALAQSLRDPSW
eukprot:CAMPEP_0174247670 /NCGR_PEP_ID=MMETSP0417-20130205/42654_1 /TAXON_ID=242541 /ORGANISM="Mayorella sp, Strain BSH-02190019" /LENGTH=573 /DNA_ID=CAMNT_0015327531 /DNA_START=100 /DNA_END=1821 /DNA_ORIENTATION=+